MTDSVFHGALLRLRCRLIQMPHGWARRADSTSSRSHLPELVNFSSAADKEEHPELPRLRRRARRASPRRTFVERRGQVPVITRAQPAAAG
jgi:hypothetical protein